MHSLVAEQEAHLQIQEQQRHTRHQYMALSSTDNEALLHLQWLQGVNIIYRWTGCSQHCMTVCCGLIKEVFVGIMLTKVCVCSQQHAAMLLCAT